MGRKEETLAKSTSWKEIGDHPYPNISPNVKVGTVLDDWILEFHGDEVKRFNDESIEDVLLIIEYKLG